MKKSRAFGIASIKARMVILVIIISVFPMALMVIMASFSYDNILKERFVSSSQNNMKRLVASINDDVDDMNASILRMLQDPNFNDLLVKQPNIDIGSIDMFNLRRDIRSYLSTIVFSKRNFDTGGIYFYENVQNITYAREAGLISEEDIPYLEMEKVAKESRGAVFYKTRVDDELNIYLIQHVLHKDTFEPLAMMYFRIDPDFLRDIFAYGYDELDESLYLYTKEGELIARQGKLNGEQIILDNAYYESQPMVLVQEYKDEEYYLITDEIKSLDLTVITIISTRILTQDSRKVVDLIAILYIAAVPLFIGLAYYLYGNIVKPVNILIGKMKQFEGGEFDTQIKEFRNDEFGYMYEAFNNMTANINTLVNDVYIKELARKDAEISALQEQINPHFLYNTLESINWRAQIAGQQDIALMIQALSKLMDASINRDKKKLIPMSEEVKYMDQYMFLMQMRYTDSLVYKTNISEEVLSIEVPKLIIQPLLENAVKYGIEPVGEGTIELNSHLENDWLIIEIVDSGKGMTAYGLSRVREIIELEQQKTGLLKGTRESVGLQNVARRMQLIYGQEASILVYSKEGAGTTITLRIPLNL